MAHMNLRPRKKVPSKEEPELYSENYWKWFEQELEIVSKNYTLAVDIAYPAIDSNGRRQKLKIKALPDDTPNIWEKFLKGWKNAPAWRKALEDTETLFKKDRKTREYIKAGFTSLTQFNNAEGLDGIKTILALGLGQAVNSKRTSTYINHAVFALIVLTLTEGFVVGDRKTWFEQLTIRYQDSDSVLPERNEKQKLKDNIPGDPSGDDRGADNAENFNMEIVKDPQGLILMDKHTLVVMLNDKQPWREIVGHKLNQMEETELPAGIICPHVVKPAPKFASSSMPPPSSDRIVDFLAYTEHTLVEYPRDEDWKELHKLGLDIRGLDIYVRKREE